LNYDARNHELKIVQFIGVYPSSFLLAHSPSGVVEIVNNSEHDNMKERLVYFIFYEHQ